MKSQTEILGTVVLVGLVLGSIAAAYSWGMPLISKQGDANRIEYAKQVFEKLALEFARIAKEGGQSSINVNVDKGEFKLELDKTGSYVLVYSLPTQMRFFSQQEVPIDDSVSPYIQKDAWIYSEGTQGWCSSGCKNGTVESAAELPDKLANAYACICEDKLELGSSTTSWSPWFSGGEGQSIGVEDYTVETIDYANNYAHITSNQYETGTGLLGKDKPGVVLAQSESYGQVYKTKLKLKPRNLFDPSNSELLVIDIEPEDESSPKATGSFSINIRNAGDSLRSENGKLIRTVTIKMSLK